MDKNKNYDLIVSIIIAHPKYSGCEAVLDEIVADVLSRTETVLNSTVNQDVLVGYIDKIVTSSIARVSRKNNLNSRSARSLNLNLERPIVSTTIRPIEEKNVVVPQEEVVIEDEPISIQVSEPEDISIADSDMMEKVIEVEQEPLEIEDYSIDISKMISFDDAIEEFAIENENIEESSLQLEEEITELVEEDDTAPLEKNEVQDTFDIASALLEKIQEENVVTTQEEEIIEEFDSEISLDLTNIDDVTVELEEKEEFVIDSVNDETIEFVDEVNTESESEMIDFVDVLDVEELSLEQPESLEVEDDLSFETTEISENLFLEDVAETTKVSLEDTVVFSEKGPYEIYKRFSFTSENGDIEEDLSSKQESLKILDKKYPDLQVFKVCELKFHKKISVSEIAELLNKSEVEILECLNEIVYAVKD